MSINAVVAYIITGKNKMASDSLKSKYMGNTVQNMSA